MVQAVVFVPDGVLMTAAVWCLLGWDFNVPFCFGFKDIKSIPNRLQWDGNSLTCKVMHVPMSQHIDCVTLSCVLHCSGI